MVFNSENQKQATPFEKGWLRRNYLALLMFLMMLGVTIALFAFKDQLGKMGNYGYLGTFLVSLFTNASIVLPLPNILMIIPLGATFNPLYIGLAAGIGGAIGEMTAYIAGYSGHKIWHDNQKYLQAGVWLKKWGMWIIFVFAVAPMPIDVMGLAAGNLRLPLLKYFVPCWLGKTIKYIILAYAGYWGWEAFNNNHVLKTSLATSGIAVAVVIILFGLALLLENWDWKRARHNK